MGIVAVESRVRSRVLNWRRSREAVGGRLTAEHCRGQQVLPSMGMKGIDEMKANMSKTLKTEVESSRANVVEPLTEIVGVNRIELRVDYFLEK